MGQRSTDIVRLLSEPVPVVGTCRSRERGCEHHLSRVYCTGRYHEYVKVLQHRFSGGRLLVTAPRPVPEASSTF